MKSLASRSIFTFVILLAAITSLAQERRGNIVEYFGKEKVEEVREGAVMHIFDEGLILKRRRSRFNSMSTPKSPVLAGFLLGNADGIKEGVELPDVQSMGAPAKWEKILAGEKSEFQDRGLSSGYLYLEYQANKAVDVLFEASGHTMALINGLPHEGDHYDFGWSLIPIRLKKGKNVFLLQGGRFPRMRARIIDPASTTALLRGI